MRTVSWNPNSHSVEMIDQRILPGELRIVVYNDYEQVVDAIRMMVIRGAPAIGVAAAFGLALVAEKSSRGNSI